MKPLRWFVIALVAGCLGLLASSASAATHPLARHHHRASQLRRTSAVNLRTASAPRPARRVPANPASHSKSRHSTAPSTRGRGHTTYGILPHAPKTGLGDRYGAFGSSAVDDHGGRLIRMLESRGPPRAGPFHRNLACRENLPLSRISPAPLFAQHLQQHPIETPRRNEGVTRSGSLAKDPLLPSVFEGAAAGPDMPSPGGIPS